ncbi:hypothetical protein [Corynebacterium sp. A21]|uniref:hypothetical protein n=1 Tax=Corynebacterium sp. A21 TaxID=3457318 RepID=UPI003FD6BED4
MDYTATEISHSKPGGNQYPLPATRDASLAVSANEVVASASSPGTNGHAAENQLVSDIGTSMSAYLGTKKNGAWFSYFGAESFSGSVTIGGASLWAPAIATPTSAGSAISRDGLGQLVSASSSQVNKLDRETLEHAAAHAMLEVTPITWRDRGAVEADPGTEKRQVGFTVEDVVRVSEAHGGSLEPVILRDAEGAPAALAYDRMPDAFTLTLLREIIAKQDALEARIAAPESP